MTDEKLRDEVRRLLVGYDPEMDHPNDIARQIIDLVLHCETCGRPADMVLCDDCERLRNMVD